MLLSCMTSLKELSFAALNLAISLSLSAQEVGMIYNEMNYVTEISLSECTEITFTYSPTGNLLTRTITGGVAVRPKAILSGAYETGSGLMRDNLRGGVGIPLYSPYLELGLVPVRDGTADSQAGSTVMATDGPNAIVDWVWVELRSANNNEQIVTTRSALLQRDGDVVDYDGTSPVRFVNTCPDDFYVVIRHRNHLAVMTAQPQALDGEPTAVLDFTSPSLPTWGTEAQRTIGGVRAMWSGDLNRDGRVIYVGANTDLTAITQEVYGATGNLDFEDSYVVSGYKTADGNLDGEVKSAGSGTDRTAITSSIYSNPANTEFEASSIVTEQLPENL